MLTQQTLYRHGNPYHQNIFSSLASNACQNTRTVHIDSGYGKEAKAFLFLITNCSSKPGQYDTMVYRQNLQEYERSDPQGYNNWGTSNSTPNNQAAQRRSYQTPPNNRPSLSSSSGRQGAIYNSFLSNYDQPSLEHARSDPPPSTERNKKVIFSQQLEVHEKQKTPIKAPPATPILRSGVRARTNQAPTPSFRQSPHMSSTGSRDPTPRAGHRSTISSQPEKKKTIHDLLNERTIAESVQTPTHDQIRSRRPHFSDSIKPSRDIFSTMELRATQSEVKASKRAMEPEAAQTLLRQARLSHQGGKTIDQSWDISELFSTTSQDGKKTSNTYRTPSSIQELLSQPPPPPPPLPNDPQRSLKAFESRNDHWDAADLYSDSWNRYLQDKSPSNASTESQDALLIGRYHPKSSDRAPPSPDSTASDIRTCHLRQEQPREPMNDAKRNGSKKVLVKAHAEYAEVDEGYGSDEDDQNGTEVVLLPGFERAEGNSDKQKEGFKRADLDRGRKAKKARNGKRLDFGTILKHSAPRASTALPSFEHFPVAGISFEESPDLNKKSTIDTSETDSAEGINIRRNLSRNLDDESTEGPENYFDNFPFSLKSSQHRRKGKWKLLWTILCLVIAALTIGLPVYFLVFVGTGGKGSGETATALKFDACVETSPESTTYSSRFTNMRKIVMGTVEGEAWRVDEPSSPQRKALCWISDFDTQIDSISGTEIPAIVQRYSLAVLYYALVPDGETSEKSLSQSNYLSSTHECEWSVVMCSSPKTVTSLLLADKLLTGPLPAEMANLANLSFLDFSINALSGNIPTSIEKLTKLEYLSLAFTSFSGIIPSEIGMLSKLEFLNMRSSNVHGHIPTELGGLSHLKTLLLDGNWLSGTIPEHLGNLGQAQQMSLRKNYLTGRVASELCELRDISLVELEVDSWIECECCTT